MVKDYGFELPDTRHTFIAKDGDKVTISIIRYWKTLDPFREDTPAYDISFSIDKSIHCTRLPIGCDQNKAIDIAHQLYQQDDEATKTNDEIDAMEAAEHRAGA